MYGWLLPLTRSVALFRDVPDVSNFLRPVRRQKQQQTPFKISSTLLQPCPVPYKFESSVDLRSKFFSFLNKTNSKGSCCSYEEVFVSFCHLWHLTQICCFLWKDMLANVYLDQYQSPIVGWRQVLPMLCHRSIASSVVTANYAQDIPSSYFVCVQCTSCNMRRKSRGSNINCQVVL